LNSISVNKAALKLVLCRASSCAATAGSIPFLKF
jgi:hypothetical protein